MCDGCGVMLNKYLLDCTLRDGGFVNDWNFGQNNIVNIFERLVDAKVDFIEIGFIDARRMYDPDRTILPDVESFETIFGSLDKGSSKILAMIDYGTCPLSSIPPKECSCIDGIRVIFKKKDRDAALEYCAALQKLGYNIFVQAVSITSYSMEEFDELLHMVNRIHPFAFSLVDTYGLLHKQQLIEYYHNAIEKLHCDIGIGYHSHNNFQLAYANCIELIEDPPEGRTLILDGSLYGMGKNAGNAPLELLAMYINEHYENRYQISQFLEAIDVTIMDIYREHPWGYSLKFYIAALNDCHPSYVSYLIDKKKLSVKAINTILSGLAEPYRLTFDKKYIERCYIEYQNIQCDDSGTIEKLKSALAGKNILLLAPGNSISEEKETIEKYIKVNQPIVISVNFLPEYPLDYLFISNSKRYAQLSSRIRDFDAQKLKVIATSNLTKTHGEFDFTVRYSSLLDEESLIIDNPQIMLLKLLYAIGTGPVSLAGFDGYSKAETPNYINANMEHVFSKEKAEEINADVIASMLRLPNNEAVQYITKTKYREQ